MNEADRGILIPKKRISSLQTIYLTLCTRCGVCREICPTYQDSKKFGLIPAEKLRFTKDRILQKSLLRRIFGPKPVQPKVLAQKANDIYGCTLCGACTQVCPHHIDIQSFWSTLRQIVNESGYTPESVGVISKNLKIENDPYGAGADLREFWIDSADLDNDPFKDEANVVYFAGCTSTIKTQNEMIPISIAKILDWVGEDWTILGENEICCGAPALMCGEQKTTVELIQANIKMIGEKRATILVTGCAGCYRMFKYEYPQFINKNLSFKVFHAVELFSQYIEEGKIKLESSDLKITYHDPCELARLGGVVKEPREILKKITRNFIELPKSNTNSGCCGGGGLLQAFDPEMVLNIASQRVRQAEEIGADILTSACPACEMALKNAVQHLKGKIEVIDIIELLARHLGILDR